MLESDIFLEALTGAEGDSCTILFCMNSIAIERFIKPHKTSLPLGASMDETEITELPEFIGIELQAFYFLHRIYVCRYRRNGQSAIREPARDEFHGIGDEGVLAQSRIKVAAQLMPMAVDHEGVGGIADCIWKTINEAQHVQYEF